MSKSYQIGVFEELLDLQNRLETDGPSIFLYQQIGECSLALCEVNQAVESLQLATASMKQIALHGR
ncbi:hypothetical protein [Alteromonas gracilis]|uniref:hypothetical protein n=1 Tax=Alteromonas gracilis TaxID=1479524 RepID=UPI0030CC3C48